MTARVWLARVAFVLLSMPLLYGGLASHAVRTGDWSSLPVVGVVVLVYLVGFYWLHRGLS